MSFAPDDTTLETDPDWVRLDNIPNLVASYTIDRGRQFELDRTDGGRATVTINDRDGVLDPTNTSGDFYGLIQPLIQMHLGRWNPVDERWDTRFRGFISDWNYSLDPSQRVNRLTLELVDLFEIYAAIQMMPGVFGFTPPPASAGQVFFEEANVDDRLLAFYGFAGIDPDWTVTFSGNVVLFDTVYSPGETMLTGLQESADAEFPGVSNFYCDRFGRSVFHGREAKFDPAGVLANGPVPDSVWDWHHWHAGDSEAVSASPSTVAQIREFAFNRGLGMVTNQALATPLFIDDADVEGQLVTDSTSVGKYGIRSWSAQNLITKQGLATGNTALEETKLFAEWRVGNYSEPNDRVTLLTLKSMDPDWLGAGPTWRMLCKADISDQIDITVDSPGGGGFTNYAGYIEGIHETNVPLNPSFDLVTMRLDVSPKSVFDDDPWAEE